jgi:hypothetical protein
MFRDDRSRRKALSAFIPLHPASAAPGTAVAVMPSVNPSLSPILHVVGFPGRGWYISVKDAYGTVVFSVMLEGMPEGTALIALDDEAAADE